MSDLISRADAIEAACNEMDWLDDGCVEERKTMIKDALSALPSAEAEPKWNCTANFVAEQLDRLRKMTDEERWDFFIKFFSPSAEAVPQSEQYKKGFEDAKRAFELEYARESENMRKRNAQLEVMLNAQKAISADAVQGEWILVKGSNGKDYHKCSKCLHTQEITGVKNYCAVCGAVMKDGDDE